MQTFHSEMYQIHPPTPESKNSFKPLHIDAKFIYLIKNYYYQARKLLCCWLCLDANKTCQLITLI